MLPLLAVLALSPPQDPGRSSQPLAIDLAADTARQVVVAREPGQYLGHVSTVLLADGRTILAASPRGHGKGAIELRRSGDGGRTWSAPLPVPADWGTSQETPTIWRLRDATGRERLVLWSGLYPARYATSIDDGHTWSGLQPAGDWGGIVVMGDIAATARPGHHLAFCHDDGRFLRAGGTASGEFTLLQVATDDGGATWSAPRAIWSDRELHLCEPGAVRLQDGGLALLLRENRRRAPSQAMFSPDDGGTWSPPQPLPPALHGDRHTIRRAADGRLVAVLRAMPLDGDAVRAPWRGDFVAWVGTDADLRGGGSGQFAVRLLDNQDSWDCGYAGLELLPDGTFVATTYGHWQRGESPYLVSVRFTLAELDARASAPVPAATDADVDASADPLADLALLEDQVPAAKAPTDPEVAAAAKRLLAAMPRRAGVDDAFSRRCTELATALGQRVVPTAAHPVRDGDPLARVIVRFLDERALRVPLHQLQPHPAATAFPGDVPAGTLPVPNGAVVDLSVPGRHSFGAYARPGSVISVRLGDGKQAPPRGLRLRIGAHSDDLHKRPSWPRMPRISRTFAVDAADLRIGSAFGGLVYLEVQEPSTGTIEVLIENTVPAPLFVLGTTTADRWREQERAQPGPWAELATGKVVLTVPSSAIRDLDDPTSVLQFWDRVLDGAADLATRPRDRARPERYVADVEIAAGHMHSGYPIMTHLDAAADMVDLARMKKGPWGLFHELGHNHQSRDWTFAGTGEVTVNVFSLYLCHVLCDVPWDQAWGGNLARARERLAACLRRGEKPWGKDGDRADLALRLLMYSQVERAFGWEAFMHTFADYRDLPADQRPKTESEKRDQWLVRLSRAIDRDLGPFFAAWGLEVSAAARAEAAQGRLAWMPDDWPGN